MKKVGDRRLSWYELLLSEGSTVNMSQRPALESRQTFDILSSIKTTFAKLVTSGSNVGHSP